MSINSFKVSKIICLLSIIFMVTMSSKVMAEEDLAFPFNSDSGKYWQYISDQVMGGVSVGKVTLEQDGEMSNPDLISVFRIRFYI